MSMSIAKLLPSIGALSHADKFWLVQLVLAQLARKKVLKLTTHNSLLPLLTRICFLELPTSPSKSLTTT